MTCNKCKRMIVLHAFTTTECKICKDSIVTGHMPGNAVCKKCANENNLCEQCGKKIEE